MSTYARAFQRGERQAFIDRKAGNSKVLACAEFQKTVDARGFFDGYMPRSSGWHTTPKPLPTAPQYMETT